MDGVDDAARDRFYAGNMAGLTRRRPVSGAPGSRFTSFDGTEIAYDDRARQGRRRCCCTTASPPMPG